MPRRRTPGDDDPATDAIYQVGTLASVLQLLKLPDGTVKVLVEGTARAKVLRYTDNPNYFEAEVERIRETVGTKGEIEALARSAVSQFENYVKLNKKISPEVLGTVAQIEDYSKLADTVASHLAVKIADKQDVLETTVVSDRLEKVYTLMESEISVLQVERKIRSRVKRQMEKTQREYYLNEQMKAIQKELGDTEERDDIAEFEEKIENTKLSKEAKDKATAELKKLKQMSPMSAEATVVRNYLDWLLSIPWGIKGKVKKDIAEAQAGARRRALRSREGQGAHPRISRGAGAHEQAQGSDPVPRRTSRRGQDLAWQVDRECHGPRVRAHEPRRRARRSGDPRPSPHLHRFDARQGHPVDEEGQADQSVVPAGRDRQDGSGLPRRSRGGSARSSRSEQNASFNDHYLEVDYDLSNVMFVTTANTLNIPPALMDRMEIIRLAGYTEDEKVEIAKRHLLTEQRQAHGLEQAEWNVEDGALLEIIRRYTREAGVRSLEREIAKLARKAVQGAAD